MQFGYRIIGDMGHIPLFFSKTPEQRPSLRTVHLSIQHRLGKNGSAGPNCTVLTINLAKCGSSLCMRFPIVTITLADVLPMAIVVAVVTITLADVSPVAIVVAVQSIHYNGVLSLSGPSVQRCTGEGRLRQESDLHCSGAHTSGLP